MVRNRFTSTVNLHTWEEIKDYYENHSSTDTAKYFDFSVCTLLRLCKKNNYTKPKDLVYKQRDYSEIKSKEYQEARKKKSLKLYGYECNLNKPEVMMKAHSEEAECLRVKSRKEFYSQVDDEYWNRRNKKSAITKELRYGNKNYNNPEKSYKTNLKNHNGKHCTGWCKYEFNGEIFDSIPELAFYIYNIENSIDIERTPITFEYEVDNRKHKYEVDFRCNNELIEIKGDHFFDGNVMINPFDRSKDYISEAKHQCGLANGVKFYTSEDYMKYVNYFNSKYNVEDFLCHKQ